MCAKYVLHKMNKIRQISVSNTGKNQRSRNFCHYFKEPFDIRAATSAVCRCCHRRFLFCKIQARPRHWGPSHGHAWSTLKKSAILSFLTGDQVSKTQNIDRSCA